MRRGKQTEERCAKLVMPGEGEVTALPWCGVLSSVVLCEVAVTKDLAGFGEALAPYGEFGVAASLSSRVDDTGGKSEVGMC